MRADHDSNDAHLAEGVVDSDPVGCPALPMPACTNPSRAGKEHDWFPEG